MKTKIKMTLGFAGEIIFFVLTGMYLMLESYAWALVALLFAMITAGYVGKLIERDAIERYKKGELI